MLATCKHRSLDLVTINAVFPNMSSTIFTRGISLTFSKTGTLTFVINMIKHLHRFDFFCFPVFFAARYICVMCVRFNDFTKIFDKYIDQGSLLACKAANSTNYPVHQD